jgi:uncharacterized membrane protein
VLLRPYVFIFLLGFVVAAVRDIGPRRAGLFMAWVGPMAFVAEFMSTRIGIPFGLYHYTGTTRGQELYLADVPFFDPLSFVFLAYAAFCLARMVLFGYPSGRVPSGCDPSAQAPSGRAKPGSPRVQLIILSGVLMMLLDVVIDPLAVRGDRWFLGRIFWYPHGGAYFGVPLSNFGGWVVVGALGVGGYLCCRGVAAIGRSPALGVGLYYGVLAFNLVMTAWIGEWALLTAGLIVHIVLAAGLVSARRLAG